MAIYATKKDQIPYVESSNTDSISKLLFAAPWYCVKIGLTAYLLSQMLQFQAQRVCYLSWQRAHSLSLWIWDMDCSGNINWQILLITECGRNNKNIILACVKINNRMVTPSEEPPTILFLHVPNGQVHLKSCKEFCKCSSLLLRHLTWQHWYALSMCKFRFYSLTI